MNKATQMKLFRLCACGCGAALKGQNSQKFFSSACRQRNYRERNARNLPALRNAENSHQCNAEGDFACVILFDEKYRPIQITFHALGAARDYVEACYKATNGRKFRVFQACNEEGFCDGFIEQQLF